MTTDPTQQPAGALRAADVASLEVARRHRVALLRDIQCFERSLAVPARNPDWRRQVGARLAALRRAFAVHTVVTEGPEGLYAELLDHAPRLAHGVHVLIREHAALAGAMSALQRRLDVPETGVEELRGSARDLLRELSRHRQRGADLVYEAYTTDIGGET